MSEGLETRRIDRSPELMSRDETALLVVDVQERLLAAQPDAGRIVWNCRRLLDGAASLGTLVLATEQVPEKLGATHPDLKGLVGAAHPKTHFSAAACQAVLATLREKAIRHVLVVGIETHVCVAQTALDLLAEGFEAKVAVDAVGSRFEVDHQAALRRIEASGVVVTTTEAALFEWCESASDEAFRAISALAKESAP